MNNQYFYLNNFSSHKQLNSLPPEGAFVLKTCQRSLVLSAMPEFDLESCVKLSGNEAYTYLLEMTCGLQSKLLGESEIVGQLKEAYHSYLLSESRSSIIVGILEKLLKDSKEIRTKYLLGLSQKTYSYITRRIMCKQLDVQNVIILGSGQLAEDLINQFKKKTNVHLIARNDARAQSLVEQHDIQALPWSEVLNISTMPYIVNTIGTDDVILGPSFFDEWKNINNQRLFIDLGSPSCIETNLGDQCGVLRLDDIFKAGAIHEEYKLKQIKNAKEAIDQLVVRRMDHLTKKNKRDEIYRQN